MSNTQTQEIFLRLPAVSQKTGIGKTSIYQRVKEGTFPPPIKLGERAVAWVDSEVSEWMASRITASRSRGVLQ